MKPLGKNGPLVPRLGLGCMSLSGIYGDPAPDAERLKFLDEAFKMGETWWDTGLSPSNPVSVPSSQALADPFLTI